MYLNGSIKIAILQTIIALLPIKKCHKLANFLKSSIINIDFDFKVNEDSSTYARC
jgi:hypothetical protein